MNFSSALTQRATRAGNGEYGFTRADAPRAIAELEQAGYAVLGGEVWLAPDAGPSLIVTVSGETAVYAWAFEDQPREDWADFVKRASREALAMLRRLRPEEDLAPEQAALVRFNFTYVDESVYSRLVRR